MTSRGIPTPSWGRAVMCRVTETVSRKFCCSAVVNVPPNKHLRGLATAAHSIKSSETTEVDGHFYLDPEEPRGSESQATFSLVASRAHSALSASTQCPTSSTSPVLGGKSGDRVNLSLFKNHCSGWLSSTLSTQILRAASKWAWVQNILFATDFSNTHSLSRKRRAAAGQKVDQNQSLPGSFFPANVVPGEAQLLIPGTGAGRQSRCGQSRGPRSRTPAPAATTSAEL